ncbi:MAG: sel1 repeat family protein [Proteobacteria bacterium]|nr:sel1 repeat family protein [Pseudomonadota bacterium]
MPADPPGFLYSKASVETLQTLADQGDDFAHLYLGFRFEDGDDQTAKDPDKALANFRAAARLGNNVAGARLAYLYLTGEMVPTDYNEAMKWALLASSKDNTDAMYYIAHMYQFGKGVQKNTQKAFDYYLRAAQRNHSESQYEVAILYQRREVVPGNDEQVLHWLTRSAEQGYAPAQYMLGRSYLTGDGVEKDLLSAGLWLGRAADRSQQDALDYLLNARQRCTSETQGDGSTSHENYCLISAGAGEPNAQFSVGTYYDSGHFLAKNPEAAFEWYRKAAMSGHLLAQAMLARAYGSGNGVHKDEIESLAWLLVVANRTSTLPHEISAIEIARSGRKVLEARMSVEDIQIAETKAAAFKGLIILPAIPRRARRAGF